MQGLNLEQTQLSSTLSPFQFSLIDNGNLSSLSDPTSMSLSPDIPLPLTTETIAFPLNSLLSWDPEYFQSGESAIMLAHAFLPHLINSYSSLSNIYLVKDTFVVGEGGEDLEIMEALGQQRGKSALVCRFR